jgi:hypothetical protein
MLPFACSSSTDADSATGTETGTEADADTGSSETSSLETVGFSGTITDFVSGTPVADMQVCVRDYPELACGTTTEEGTFELVVPSNAEIVVDITRDTLYMPSTHHAYYTQDAVLNTRVATFDTMALLVSQAGETIDPQKGHIPVGGAEGSTVTMTPESGTIVYFDENNIPDPNLTAMTSSQLAGIGNVNPGEVEVQVSHPTLNCTTPLNWPGSTDGAYRVVVEPETLSGSYTANCQ